MLAPGRMTRDAILNIAARAFLLMFVRDVRLRMLLATVTGVHCVVDWMAHRARGFAAPQTVIERKRVFDQTRWFPRGRRVARGAIGSKLAAMHLRIGMTARAIARHTAPLVIRMALRAFHLRVFAGERKDARVIEPLQIVRAVVTTRARVAELFAMIRDEHRVLQTVTINARALHIRAFVLRGERMTRATGHWRVRVIALMAREREAELIVRKINQRCARELRRTALVIGVARDAVGRVLQIAVHAGCCRQLIARVRVARVTPRGLHALKWRVAQFTARFKFRVRRETAQRAILRSLGAERSRIVQRSPGDDADADDAHDQREHRAAT